MPESNAYRHPVWYPVQYTPPYWAYRYWVRNTHTTTTLLKTFFVFHYWEIACVSDSQSQTPPLLLTLQQKSVMKFCNACFQGCSYHCITINRFKWFNFSNIIWCSGFFYWRMYEIPQVIKNIEREIERETQTLWKRSGEENLEFLISSKISWMWKKSIAPLICERRWSSLWCLD